MTTTMQPDTQGIDALSGGPGDNVGSCPTLIWDELVAELGPPPPRPHIDPFDEQPWLALPTMQELEELWSSALPLERMLHRVAVSAHGGGDDLPRYLAAQRQLADWEYQLKKERQASDGQDSGTDDGGAAGSVASVVSVDAQRGRGGVSGGPENGHAVGEGGETEGDQDAGRPPKVPGKRGAGKTTRRRGKVVADEVPEPAAAVAV